MLSEFKVKVRGVCPLLLKNGQTADPLNRFSKQMKELTCKKKKTDEDHAEISRIEWHSALYVNQDEKIVLPGNSFEASIYEGAKKSKLGRAFKSAVFVYEDAILDIGIKYAKASDLWGKEQFRDVRGVAVQGKRIMRTRPIFNEWQAEFKVIYDDEQVNLADVQRAINDAGIKCGVGDFRPRFGRFEVV